MRIEEKIVEVPVEVIKYIEKPEKKEKANPEKPEKPRKIDEVALDFDPPDPPK